MGLKRILRHMFAASFGTRRRFPPRTLAAIEQAIRETEARHSGEIRFVIETALDGRPLLAGMSPRERAVELFAAQRVWDTELDNGVLIYVLLADRDVEIVADRGFNGRVSAAEWETVCVEMERHFRAGEFEAGAVAGVRRVGELIERHFPPQPGDRNELPDRPLLG